MSLDSIAQELIEQIVENIDDINTTNQNDIASATGDLLGSLCKEIFNILGVRNAESYAADAFSSSVGETTMFDDEDTEFTKEEIQAMEDEDFDDMFFLDPDIEP